MTMPVFTDTSSGYVRWQNAQRQTKQNAHDAAIDIIEHYNRMVLTDSTDKQEGHYQTTAGSMLKGFTEEDSFRVDMNGKTKKLTPRGNKPATLRDNSLDSRGRVFTEGISSFSRRSKFPLSLKRSDFVSENLPDNIKIAREKSRIYLALSQPSSRQNWDTYRSLNKADNSAKSAKTLPNHSYPWSEMLPVTELTRAKTFTHGDRVGLATRSTLDSRQTASDIQPVKDKRPTGDRQGTQFTMYYPSITGAPPNTPLNMPLTHTRKVPSVNIVSLGAETVENTMKRPRPRLPVSLRGLSQDPGPPRGKGNVGTATSSKPGIDLPHLPLRYADAKDASFQFTPRGWPGRMNYNAYNRSRRHAGLGQLKQNAKVTTDITALADSDNELDDKAPTNDPYADRFRQVSSVMSVGEVQISFAAPTSAAAHQPGSGPEDKETLLPEPAVMLTVQEEGESKDGSCQTKVNLTAQPKEAEDEVEKQIDLDELPRVLLPGLVHNRSQSIVSNASLLSVPATLVKDLSDARRPLIPSGMDDAGPIAIDLATTREGQVETKNDGTVKPGQSHSESEAEGPAPSPEIASTSVINTARTIATQTSLPYDPDVSQRRPAVLKIKTLSMFQDVNTSAEVQTGGQRPKSATTSTGEALLRMTHGHNHGDANVLGLPELHGEHVKTKELLDEERCDGSKWKSNGVQNITFISPVEVQQNAKRF